MRSDISQDKLVQKDGHRNLHLLKSKVDMIQEYNLHNKAELFWERVTSETEFGQYRIRSLGEINETQKVLISLKSQKHSSIPSRYYSKEQPIRVKLFKKILQDPEKINSDV